MVLDSEQLKKNAQTLLERFSNAKLILRKANGKMDYKEISNELSINEKIVSPALSSAKDLGFAEKVKPGIYKKISSTMKYIPNIKNHKEKDFGIDNVIKRFSKNKGKNKEISGLKQKFSYQGKVEKMALAYKWLFITENILRDLIRKVIGSTPNWWENRIPDGVKSSVIKEIQKSKYDDAARKDNLEYTHLGQLKEIIIWKKNWKDFEPFLKSKDRSNFEHELNKVIPPRNAIGHCIPLVGDDYEYAEMRFKAVLKLLK